MKARGRRDSVKGRGHVWYLEQLHTLLAEQESTVGHSLS